MKKIVLASAAMGGAALVAFGASGTFAAFSDETSVQDQVATAGVLQLDASGAAEAPATAANIAPGSTVYYPYYVTNTSKTISGSLGGFLTDVVNLDNTCFDSEALAGDNCTNDAGELSSQLFVTYYELKDISSESACLASKGPGANDTVDLGYLNTGTGSSAATPGAKVLSPGQAACYMVGLKLVDKPDNVNNLVQSDITTFSVRFELVQSFPRTS